MHRTLAIGRDGGDVRWTTRGRCRKEEEDDDDYDATNASGSTTTETERRRGGECGGGDTGSGVYHRDDERHAAVRGDDCVSTLGKGVQAGVEQEHVLVARRVLSGGGVRVLHVDGCLRSGATGDYEPG